MQIIADPTKFNLYNFEHPRLSDALQDQLAILKASPSKRVLDAFKINTTNRLASSIARISIGAYHQAASQVKETIDISETKKLSAEALERAKTSASLISKTSSKTLDINAISMMRVASKDRSEFISSYELRLAFFLGTTRGWSLNKRAKKMWLLSSMHDMDDICDDNADQGAISVFEFFDSGAMYCPGHIGCFCNMALILPEDN